MAADKPFTRKCAIRLWENIKDYVAQHTYPKLPPPKFYFDPATASLYMEKPAVGYDFIVVDGRFYYKER